MNISQAHIIQNLGNSGFFSLWDPEIDGFTRGADWTGGWRRESVHILTFTIDHVCNLIKENTFGKRNEVEQSFSQNHSWHYNAIFRVKKLLMLSQKYYKYSRNKFITSTFHCL